MMTNVQYLLGKLAEEASELAQIAIKAQQFGLDEVFGGQETPLSNAERISGEFSDVVGVIAMLQLEENADIDSDDEAVAKKMVKVDKWRKYARELGLVEEKDTMDYATKLAEHQAR